MLKLRPLLIAFTLGCTLIAPSSLQAAKDRGAVPDITVPNTVCPVTGKAVDPKVTLQYDGSIYAFADEASRAKWKAERENSLFHKLGGKAAIEAAVERFYVIMLADERVKHIFDDVDMPRQRRKQKEFLSAAFGGPNPWKGKDLRAAHADIKLTETHFQAVAENLQKSLEDLKVPKDLIGQVMAIAASTHDDVLNKPKAPTAK